MLLLRRLAGTFCSQVESNRPLVALLARLSSVLRSTKTPTGEADHRFPRRWGLRESIGSTAPEGGTHPDWYRPGAAASFGFGQ